MDAVFIHAAGEVLREAQRVRGAGSDRVDGAGLHEDAVRVHAACRAVEYGGEVNPVVVDGDRERDDLPRGA